ncbi:MAG: hypothetical protein V7K67_16695 [Nostoc sp.]|uniref:hypothetical protein n=1 Tax=Nostoc sp. TaxID=1180 RepID=UPI002FF0D33D
MNKPKNTGILENFVNTVMGVKTLNQQQSSNTLIAKVLNVNKNSIKIAQNMLNFGRKIKVYLFDSDYKFISQDCQRYLEGTAKKRLSSIEQSSVL